MDWTGSPDCVDLAMTTLGADKELLPPDFADLNIVEVDDALFNQEEDSYSVLNIT